VERKTQGIAALLALCLLLVSCAQTTTAHREEKHLRYADGTEGYVSFVDDEPDTTDPQCSSDAYTVALNVFDRLVEFRADADGRGQIVPSLAESWEISDDGYLYTFCLREGVRFSNGAALTAWDVRYTFERMLTWPDSCHGDLLECIFGAHALSSGRTETLSGLIVLDERTFSVVLEHPCASFLVSLSAPAASILCRSATEAAGTAFGHDPETMIGTGPFIFTQWVHGSEMLLAANPDCWSGAPSCEGLAIRIVPDEELQSVLFENGELDILDLDNMSSEAEYYIRGDIYQERLYCAPRVGISYLALNENVTPLDDVRVRRALQLALDRGTLLGVAFGGRGSLENGIFPRGLTGYNPELPEIPYDPEAARALLCEAGLEDGFDLKLSASENSPSAKLELLELIAYMWEQVGVRVEIELLDESNYNARLKSGVLACYYARWSADFNDPQNFIDTFFGSEEKTRSRSLCYRNTAVMQRVSEACRIPAQEERIRVYRELEKQIVQEDAAWVPLYSNQHYFVVSERVKGFNIAWNGWSNNCYRDVSVS
jgi:ABC-type transport system substrate-binding protein